MKTLIRSARLRLKRRKQAFFTLVGIAGLLSIPLVFSGFIAFFLVSWMSPGNWAESGRLERPLTHNSETVSFRSLPFVSDSEERLVAPSEFAVDFLYEDLKEPPVDDSRDIITVMSRGGGTLYQRAGLPILVLEGSFEEMGYQYGLLQGQRIRSMLALIDSLAERESSGLLPQSVQVQLRRKLGELFERHFPESARHLVEGIRRGAATQGVELHPLDLAFLNSLIDIAGIGSTNLSFSVDGLNAVSALVGAIKSEVGLGWFNQNCNTFAAFGSRTVDGKTFQTRNTDVTVGLGLERFPLVTAFFPKSEDGKSLVPFVTAGFAGQVGVSTGLNAHGVGLGQVWAFSNEKAIGAPWSLVMIDVMSQARTATEAAEILTAPRASHHTYGNNFTFADASGDAIVVELNAVDHDFFRAADPREVSEGRMTDGRVWAVPLEDAIVRADFSMSRVIRSRQTSARGPNGYPPLAGSYQKRYAGQIKRILGYERIGRPIGAHEAMVISRATADRRSGNLQLAVYANTDRRMWVAYAKEVDGQIHQAFERPFIHIPFDGMLAERGWDLLR